MIVEQLFHLKINADRNSPEYCLSSYFLGHKHALNHLTLKNVIQDTSFSKSTIIRYFQSLQAANFTQFLYDYQNEISTRLCRERVLVQNREHGSLWEKDTQNPEYTHFIQASAKAILQYKKLIVVGELRDIILAEPCLPHLFDLDIECEVIWDKPSNMPSHLSNDAYYLILMSHYTPSNFLTGAHIELVKHVKTILNHPEYEKGIVSYPTPEKMEGNFVYLPRNTKPIDKKIQILALFGELHNQILYGMSPA